MQYDVILESIRPEYLACAMWGVRVTLGVGVNQAHQLVVHAPKVLCHGVPLERAESLKAALEQGCRPSEYEMKRIFREEDRYAVPPDGEKCCTVRITESD